MARLSKILFVLEAMLGLTMLALLSDAVLAIYRVSPGLLFLIEFIIFVVFVLVALLYVYGAWRATRGATDAFWSSFVPATCGLPILAWGIGKLAGIAPPLLIAAAVAGPALLFATTPVRSYVARSRVLPILLPVLFLLTANLPNGRWLHLVIGGVLLGVPIALIMRLRRGHGPAQPSANTTNTTRPP